MKLPDQIRKVATNSQLVNKNKQKLTFQELLVYQREKLIKDTEYINTIAPQLNISVIFLISFSFCLIYLKRKRFKNNYYELLFTHFLDLEKSPDNIK
jgi:hypothetical protein